MSSSKTSIILDGTMSTLTQTLNQGMGAAGETAAHIEIYTGEQATAMNSATQRWLERKTKETVVSAKECEARMLKTIDVHSTITKMEEEMAKMKKDMDQMKGEMHQKRDLWNDDLEEFQKQVEDICKTMRKETTTLALTHSLEIPPPKVKHSSRSSQLEEPVEPTLKSFPATLPSKPSYEQKHLKLSDNACAKSKTISNHARFHGISDKVCPGDANCTMSGLIATSTRTHNFQHHRPPKCMRH